MIDYDFLNANSITLLTMISFFIASLTNVLFIEKKQVKIVLYGIILLIFLLSFPFFPHSIIHIPLSIIPVIGIPVTLWLLWKKKASPSFLKKYSLIQYIILLLLLLIAMEFAKVTATTWGADLLYSGVFMLTYIVPLLHLTRMLYDRDSIYGILNIIAGFCSIAIILIFGFESSEYSYGEVMSVRTGIVLLSIGLILEGAVFIFINEYNGREN